jgi:hypothetical protein
VSFHTALGIPDSDRGDKVEVKLHTTMSARELSKTTASSDWYDFSISSWVAGTATTHFIGGLSMCTKLLVMLIAILGPWDSISTG